MKKELAIGEMTKDKSSEEDNIFTHRIFVPLLALFACFLWGSAFPSLKISYRFYRQKTRWACPLDECRYL